MSNMPETDISSEQDQAQAETASGDSSTAPAAEPAVPVTVPVVDLSVPDVLPLSQTDHDDLRRMFNFALSQQSMRLDQSLITQVVRVLSCPPVKMGREDQVTFWMAYDALAVAVAPASAISLRYMEQLNHELGAGGTLIREIANPSNKGVILSFFRSLSVFLIFQILLLFVAQVLGQLYFPDNKATEIDTILRTILPAMFGALGSSAYIARDLSDSIKGSYFLPQQKFRYMLRIVLGATLGILCSLLYRDLQAFLSQELSVSAAAFLAGYGVEAVFTLLDSLINKFRETVQVHPPLAPPPKMVKAGAVLPQPAEGAAATGNAAA